jgi:hypothetical protein
MKDQLSAGLREVEKNLCEEARYCREDGTLSIARVVLSDGIANGAYADGVFIEYYGGEEFSDNGRKYLPTIKSGDWKGTPSAWNMPKTPLFDKTFYIDKTAGEAIKFTYQVHLTPYDIEIVVGNALAESNPLIKKWNENRKFKLWLMRNYLREGEDIIVENNDISYEGEDFIVESYGTEYEQTKDGQYFEINKEELSEEALAKYGEMYHLSLTTAIIDELLNKENNYVAWAITDENNRLYVGINSRLNFDLFFQVQHKRK